MKQQINVTNKLRRSLHFIASCPQCWPHRVAFGLMFLCLLFVAWAFGVAGRDSVKDYLVTTTITATTESFRFVTPASGEAVWILPPGRFSILGIADNEQCTVRNFESVCNYDANSRLVINGAADITVKTTPDGGWTMSVAEVESAAVESTRTTSAPITTTKTTAIDARLLDAGGDALLHSDQFLEFHTDIAARAIRMPFVANVAVLGGHLHESSTMDGSAYDYWQPVLLTGDVLMIADNKPGLETYQVHAERLDPGDVVHIGEESSALAVDGGHSVWGMLTINSGGQTAATPDAVVATIQVVLHTSLREVSVTRFGAPRGHVIKASLWSILQKWPRGQSVWVAFVSMLLILGFALQLGGTFAGSAKGAGTQPPPLGLKKQVQKALRKEAKKKKAKEKKAEEKKAKGKIVLKTEARLDEAQLTIAPGTAAQAAMVEGMPTLSSNDELEEKAQEEKKNVDRKIPPPPH